MEFFANVRLILLLANLMKYYLIFILNHPSLFFNMSNI